MQRYDTYKDSGVKWLGEIPEHWEVKRLASYFTERRVKVSDKDFEPLSVTKLGVFPQWENVAKTNDGDNRKLVKKGDFVINSRSDRKGSSGISDRDGSVSLINIVLQPRKTILAQFSNYLLKSYRFIEEYYRNGRGIVADLWTTRYDEMKMIKLAIPPLKEQEAIANYLDTATAKIDSAIAQQQKMIDLLNERKQIIINNAVTKGLNPNAKMKDSGVEWIGEIPEGWDTCALKKKAKVILGKMLSNNPTNKYKYICAKDVHYGEIDTSDLKEMSFTHEERQLYEVKKGDMLIVEGGAGAGGCAIVKEDLKNIYIQNSIMIVRGAENLLNDYLCFFMQSINQKGYIEYICNKATIPHFTKEKVGAVIIPLPPFKKQVEIVDYLNTAIAPIDDAIKNCQNQISLLQERKQIIINEVVTGKEKVG